jgi:hypothetical protein
MMLNNIKEIEQNHILAIGDQLDMQYWDKINGTNNWQDAINAVKATISKSI